VATDFIGWIFCDLLDATLLLGLPVKNCVELVRRVAKLEMNGVEFVMGHAAAARQLRRTFVKDYYTRRSFLLNDDVLYNSHVLNNCLTL